MLDIYISLQKYQKSVTIRLKAQKLIRNPPPFYCVQKGWYCSDTFQGFAVEAKYLFESHNLEFLKKALIVKAPPYRHHLCDSARSLVISN